MPGQVGRPSLFEERSPKFLEQIENGLPTRAAAALAAVHVDTVMQWLAKRPGAEKWQVFRIFRTIHARQRLGSG